MLNQKEHPSFLFCLQLLQSRNKYQPNPLQEPIASRSSNKVDRQSLNPSRNLIPNEPQQTENNNHYCQLSNFYP